ncbi:MAG: ATP-binding protein [Pseudohongiella sp.]|nr:ATP-binding protein [Pseudohongiella sp.]
MENNKKPALTIREVDATPYASSLIEGHRDFGYNLETALADVIDNSITAGATYVKLVANSISDAPFIAIVDDGSGMTETQLIEAMRLGSKNPKDIRAKSDLGRFGLGLKSASFSQCRCLTVITRQDSISSCARWDLDRFLQRRDWSLELIDNPIDIPNYYLLPKAGTIVIWEKLDRLLGNVTQDRDKSISFMNDALVRAEKHLRLVFHRFLEGTKPKLKLYLNERQLKPIDPMASRHPATQKAPEDDLKIADATVKISCYTLPHHQKMTREEWDEIGGPEGHLKSQGLYIYRENRLIITGGWLGLARQTELTKLCRVAVDIPNTMDSEWKIDVKKASAQLPPLVRERLKKVVERFVGTSKRTYTHKGQILVDETRFPIWNRIKCNGQTVFRPNTEHPVFRSYSAQLPPELREGFERCLRLIGSGLPIETLHAELTGNPESVVSDETSDDDLKPMVYAMAKTLSTHGVPNEGLIDALLAHPFLRSNQAAVIRVLEEYFRENK